MESSNTIISLTPSKQYKPPSIAGASNNDTNSLSTHSTPSIGSNYFPSYGLIKISNTDDLDSMDSFPLSASIQNHNSNTKSLQVDALSYAGDRKSNPFYENASLSGLSTSTSTATSKTRDINTIPTLLNREQDGHHSDVEYPHIQDIPKFGITRSKYCFDKIIESYHSTASKGGVFLTEDIFLNNNIFKLNETIQNGSVKINIIQEINELLKKFLVNETALQPTNSTVQSILPYYKKLMDAFDVLKVEQFNQETLENDSIISDSNSSFNYSPQKVYTNDSSSINSNSNISPNQRNSRTSSQSHPLHPHHHPHAQPHAHPPLSSTTSNSSNPPPFIKEHKRSDSFLLGKFKNRKNKHSSLSPSGKKTVSPTGSTFQFSASATSSTSNSRNSGSSKPSSPGVDSDYKNSKHSSLQSSAPATSPGNSGTGHTGPYPHLKPNHSRSLSVSTITTQTSSRSTKDQASISEYLTALEFLQITLGEIHDEYITSEDEELCHKLNLIMEFLNDYILRFVIQDVLNLIVKHMKKSVLNFTI